MDVFGKGTDEPSRPLLPPGTCWICSNSPQQEEMKVIDTRRNTQAGGALSHASVRIYVCEPCVNELGKAMGMVSREDYRKIFDQVADAHDMANKYSAEAEEARASQTRVVDADEIMAQIAKLAKPRTAAPKKA